MLTGKLAREVRGVRVVTGKQAREGRGVRVLTGKQAREGRGVRVLTGKGRRVLKCPNNTLLFQNHWYLKRTDKKGGRGAL